jgi:hypothetical protein
VIDGQTIKANQTRMESARWSYESAWGEIARLVYPEMASFYGGGMYAWSYNQGMPFQAVQMHDPYAAQALEDGVSLFEGFVMPRGQRWQQLKLGDEALMRKVSVRQWVEQVEMRLFAQRMNPESGFVGAVHESAMSLYAFCTQSMWVDLRYDWTGQIAGLSYQSEFIGEIYIERDAEGRPMRIHRKFALNAEQARLKWGARKPPSVTKALEGPNAQPTKMFEFIHVIERNGAAEPGRSDWRGMPWASCYMVSAGGDEESFAHGGYRSLPRIVSSFARAARSPWGRSPTMRVLPKIRLLQEIERDRVLGAELRLKPPLLTDDDELDGAILALRPHGITHGGLDDRGNPKFRTFLEDTDATDARYLGEEARAAIDKAYGKDLLQLNRELKTHITATRTAEENAEKGLLLAPLARQEGEWLAPMTTRELALMGEIGLLDDMPGEVAEYFADRGEFAWEFDNELSKMMEASKSAAFLSVAEQVGLLAQYDKTYVEDFRREFPPHRVLPELGRIARVPAAMMATAEDLAAYDEKKAADEQAALLLQAAEVAGNVAKNAAQAGAIEGV